MFVCTQKNAFACVWADPAGESESTGQYTNTSDATQYFRGGGIVF